MASKKGVNLQRLLTILDRQAVSCWGNKYIPSILATPQEAPSVSRVSILNSKKIGREIHLLSLTERAAGLLALYHPDLFDLQEQKMLSTTPTPHPLFGYQNYTKSCELPGIKGVIDVADRLGYLSLLPKVRAVNPENHLDEKVIIFPYVGDLLLFMNGANQHKYCVNWSIKDKRESFEVRPLGMSKSGKIEKKNKNTFARHEMEDVYYKDAGIRTLRISNEHLNWHVTANLTQLFGYHGKRTELSIDAQQHILNKFELALDTETKPYEVILALMSRYAFTDHQCRTVLYQSIWNRKLRVDLFKPILIDRPLNPESRDVLAEYAEWFRECPC